MQDEKTLRERLEEVTEKERAAYNEMQAREKELEPEVKKKKEELDNQIVAAENELSSLRSERSKIPNGFLRGIFNKSKKAENDKAIKELDAKI